jgi:hypothetical protein
MLSLNITVISILLMARQRQAEIHDADRHWAASRSPTYRCRHGRFYQHLLTTLGIGYDPDDIPSIRNFDPLPEAIREQASWGRLLSDPSWGALVVSSKAPRAIPFLDITRGHGRSAA